MFISATTTKKLTNGNHFKFHYHKHETFVKYGSVVPSLAAMIAQYGDAIKDEDAVMVKVNKSEYTEQIRGISGKCCSVYRSMVDITNANLNHYEDNIKNAAAKVQAVWGTYGNIAKKSLTEQESALDNIVSDIDESLGDHLKTLGLTGWAEKLTEYYAEFSRLVKNRLDQTATRTTEKLSDVRVRVDGVHKTLTQHLEAIIVLEGISKYQDLVNRLNAVVAKYGIVRSNTTSKKPEPVVPEEQKPEEVTPPIVEEKYPDAKEWTNMVDVGDFKLGDICFVVIDGVKKYYEMIEESNFNVKPNGGEGELGWKPLQ